MPLFSNSEKAINMYLDFIYLLKTRPVEGSDGELTIQEVEQRAGGPPALGSQDSVLLYVAAST